MIEIVVLIGLVAAWGGPSPDRVAAPARSAARSGVSAGARSAGKSARDAWRSGAPGRADRAARGRARFASWGWFGRGLNWFTDRVQAGVFGLGRIGWGAASIGWGAVRDGWSAGRDGWRWRAAEHRTARRFGEKSAWGQIGGIIRDTCKPPTGSPAVPLWQRIKDGARDIVRTIRPLRDAATGDDPAPTDPPSPTGDGPSATDAPTTPKETKPVANPTGQLDIPDINALQALAAQLAAASEIATQMAGHSMTTTGLPDALDFDPGKGVIEAIHSLAEVSPDPKTLAAWAELVHVLKRAVDKRVAELEILATTQVKGHTDQLTPA